MALDGYDDVCWPLLTLDGVAGAPVTCSVASTPTVPPAVVGWPRRCRGAVTAACSAGAIAFIRFLMFEEVAPLHTGVVLSHWCCVIVSLAVCRWCCFVEAVCPRLRCGLSLQALASQSSLSWARRLIDQLPQHPHPLTSE